MLVSAVHQHKSAVDIQMCPRSWTFLPPSTPSKLSQSTGFELPASYSKFSLVICFTYGKAYVSMIDSQFVPLSPSSTVSTSLFFMSASPFSSVQSFSHVWLFQPYGLQNARLPCPSPTPGACSNSSPLSRCCHPTISSSVTPFSSCLQSFPTSGSFLIVSSLHQMPEVLVLQLQHQSFQWIFRTAFL